MAGTSVREGARAQLGNGSVLRVFRFRPVGLGSDVDGRLRDELLPPFVRLGGLREAYVGRRGPDDASERIIVSIWNSSVALTSSVAEDGRLEIETAPEVGPAGSDVVPLAVDLRFDRQEAARVLRLFRGTVRPEQLDIYIDEARDGTIADAMGPHGPLGLYLGPQPPDRFITVSIWTDWASIEAATHGNVRQPIATSNAGRLSGGTATHFEIVPNTAHRPVGELRAG